MYHVDGFRYDCVPNYWDGPLGVGYANLVYETYQLTKAKLAGPPSHWSRFDGGPGEPLRLIQCAEQLEGPEEVLRTTYSNCTWQNGTFDAAHVGGAWRPRPADRLGLASRACRLSRAGRQNGDVIPKSALQYLENHDHERFVCNFGLSNPDEAGNPLFPEGDRSRWFMVQPYLIATSAEQGHSDALAGRGIRRELLPARLRRWAGGAASSAAMGLLLRRGRARLVSLVRKLLRMRRERAQLRRGRYFFFNRLGALPVARRAAVRPIDGTDYTLVAVNTTDTEQTVPFWFPIAGDYARNCTAATSASKPLQRWRRRR